MPEMELETMGLRHPTRLHQVESRLEADTRSMVEGLRGELDSYYRMAKGWAGAEPDLVLEEISSISARLIEVRAMMNRDKGQRANRLRIDEIDPLLEHLEFQFKIHSRLQAIREFDFKSSGAQT